MIASGSRRERFLGYSELAFAYADVGNIEQAISLADRAFDIWHGEIEFIDRYIAVLKSAGDTARIKQVSKRAGMWLAARDDIWAAIGYFNTSHYAEQSAGNGDRYQQDHDILRAVEVMAGVTSGDLPRRFSAENAPIRVAYLVYGAAHTSSVLVRIALDFARHHDPKRFECAFFSPDADTPPSLSQNSALLRSAGAELRTINSTDGKTCLFETASEINRFQPDILVSFAALADFRQYYLFTKCPATARVSLCYGPPAQFVPPTADLAISATLHPAMDCPCDAKVVEIETALPTRPALVRLSDADPEAVVILAAGRSEKFLDKHYWELILSVLTNFPKARFIAIGISKPPDFLGKVLASGPGQRVEILGWLEDYQQYLAQADVVIDTFPSGGGMIVLDAMAFGIPVLTFANDYVGRAYDQTSWNPAEEFLNDSSLIVPRGDFAEFAKRLGELLADPVLRQRLGASSEKRAREFHGNPERMIRRIENVYVSLLASVKAPVEVRLLSSTGYRIKRQTDEMGRYFVTDLPEGKYDVEFSSGEIACIVHGGGRFEGKAGISEILDVSLHNSTGISVNLRTDGKGRYYVKDLPEGEYTVRYSTGEVGSIFHGGGRFEGQATIFAPSKSDKEVK
jgi:glycosyltransferase involved in cell wall biosynthesis